MTPKTVTPEVGVECWQVYGSREKQAIARINEQIEVFKPTHVFSLFSGGHDSLSTAIITSQAIKFDAVVHIDTGTGVPETRQFVEDTCARQSWPLKIYEALKNTNAKGEPDPQDYREIVRKYGFPGPAGHGAMYVRLKERCIRMLCRDHKVHARDRIMLVAGCRNEESVRRMGTTLPISRDGCKVWVNPIHDWTKGECNLLIQAKGLERNWVCDVLHRSGECNCGAFAEKGELKEMVDWFPHMAWIYDLQAEVEGKHPWKWGERPPKKTEMPKAKVGIMCSGCGK